MPFSHYNILGNIALWSCTTPWLLVYFPWLTIFGCYSKVRTRVKDANLEVKDSLKLLLWWKITRALFELKVKTSEDIMNCVICVLHLAQDFTMKGTRHIVHIFEAHRHLYE